LVFETILLIFIVLKVNEFGVLEIKLIFFIFFKNLLAKEKSNCIFANAFKEMNFS